MDTQLNFNWGSGNDKQTMHFVFVIKIRHKSVSRDNGKIAQKEMSKLFSCGCFTTHFYSMVKCPRNVNFDTEPSVGKNDGFWLLWGLFKVYIEENIIMAVLRKVNSHSDDICRLTKNK